MSEIRATTISDAAGTGPIDLYKQSAAKAWINFNGTGTIAIRDSMNVASLTDNGAGQQSFTLTNAMSNTSYAAQVTPRDGGYMGGFNHTSSTASLVRVSAVTDAGAFSDSNVMACSTLGDLA